MAIKQENQVVKNYSFKIIDIKKEDLAKKLAESLRNIDIILDKLQVNILGNKSMFVENANNPKATIVLGSLTGIEIDPIHENEVTVNVAINNAQAIETIDRELEIDPDNYRVEVIFDASTDVAKVIMFKLNTKSNIENRHKQKQNKPKGKRRLFTVTKK